MTTNQTRLPFDVDALASALPEYLRSARWFRAKARRIDRVSVQDVVALPKTETHVLVLRVGYSEGDYDYYVLPVSAKQESGEMIARLGNVALYSALADPTFPQALLDAIACDQSLPGLHGAFVAAHTSAFDRSCGAEQPALTTKVSQAEQSNTSILYGDRYILKLFRKVEAGLNPDLEIGAYLTEHRFPYTPAVLGHLQYRPAEGEPMDAAILQGFVRNEGDAWAYTLRSLAGYFERALTSDEAGGDSRELIGPYLGSARLLGERTAQMHAALTDPNAGPDFRPEPFTPEFARQLYDGMIGEANAALGLLKQQNAQGLGREVLDREADIRTRFEPLRHGSFRSLRIRHHGDYHLGQVLYTGSDFSIIDFEGEPTRPLAERRIKASAMKDVAGMVRSFHYAAYAALFGQAPGVSAAPERLPALDRHATFWYEHVSAAYLDGYFRAAGHQPFVAPDPHERRVLLDVFVLQKALYEVAYELNNRPDWVSIPLRGILSLLSKHGDHNH